MGDVPYNTPPLERFHSTDSRAVTNENLLMGYPNDERVMDRHRLSRGLAWAGVVIGLFGVLGYIAGIVGPYIAALSVLLAFFSYGSRKKVKSRNSDGTA